MYRYTGNSKACAAALAAPAGPDIVDKSPEDGPYIQPGMIPVTSVLGCHKGHGNKRVIEAMKRQAEKVSFAHTSQFTSSPAEMLARELMKHTPPGLNRVFFVSGGSEAIESALKASFQYHFERDKKNKKKKLNLHGKPPGGYR